jgi:peroxiredoxin (alkyl hydroperoxide reductase subunit C)
MMTTDSLVNVDWSSLPVPEDDGGADHLVNTTLPPISLPSTDGPTVTLSTLTGKTVLYIYPRTGQPGKSNPDGWDAIPGTRINVYVLIQAQEAALLSHAHFEIMQRSFTISA